MATIESREIRYAAGGDEMVGYLAWDASREGPRPGVIVIHEWWGANDYVRRRADMLAELGYAGFAIDLYGGGRVAADPDEAGMLMNGLTGDLPRLRERFAAALAALRAQAVVGASKVGAIGYCMGGGIALHVACHGADLAAVASFHGALPLATAGADGAPRPSARLAVYHGEADAFVTLDDAAAFRSAMEAAGADLLFVLLPGATHGFTNPLATERGEKYGLPLRYSALADRSSWEHMQLVMREALA